jgi:PAS domain S-box-containing protein
MGQPMLTASRTGLYADIAVRHDDRDHCMHSWLRSAGVVRLAVPALIVLLGVAGFVVTREAISQDRDAAAARRAQLESVRTQALLGRARAYIAGLGNVLAGEPVAGQRRFAQLVGSTGASIGLVDALWVQQVAGSRRRAYERRLGAPITRLTPSGALEPAPPQASHLPATYTTGTRTELRPGVDVSGWPALASAIRDPASILSVSATDPGSLGSQRGFYLLEAGRFGAGPTDRGVLAVFVPQGWLTLSTEDPQRLAISLGGRRLLGGLHATPTAGAGFETLARRWRVDVGTAPASGLQSELPWFALAWPIAAAFVVWLAGRGIMRRRRAERDAERTFDLSVDLLCIAGTDGYFKRVNPAFERTLGYSREELLSRPFLSMVHPDDRASTREVVRALARGDEVMQFENRYLCRDGSPRWLEWSSRPMEEGLIYSSGRDVTDRRRAEDQLLEAQRLVEISRDELRLLADEQAALRRVATLVAQGGSPTRVFEAVAAEVGGLLGAEHTSLMRYEPDGTVTVVAGHGEPAGVPADVARVTLQGESISAQVQRTGAPARGDTYEGAPGSLAALLRKLGIRSSAGAPIVVAGRLWGVIVASWKQDQALSADVERRMAQFTELVATAIANADSRAELTASRARVVAAGDETRRRIERNLHDGTQQRLVALALELRAVEAKLPAEMDEIRADLSQAATGLAGAVEDLQEVARGIHPAILSRGGLGAALRTLARRAGVPVELDMKAERPLPGPVDVAAYYVVSEALTNAAKHAQASVVRVELKAEDSIVELAIRDDGVGGADPERGSGLIGLRDRVEALGGTIEIASGPGRGTSVVVTIPIDGIEQPAG